VRKKPIGSLHQRNEILHPLLANEATYILSLNAKFAGFLWRTRNREAARATVARRSSVAWRYRL